jgi:hypothetical protein
MCPQNSNVLRRMHFNANAGGDARRGAVPYCFFNTQRLKRWAIGVTFSHRAKSSFFLIGVSCRYRVLRPRDTRAVPTRGRWHRRQWVPGRFRRNRSERELGRARHASILCQWRFIANDERRGRSQPPAVRSGWLQQLGTGGPRARSRDELRQRRPVARRYQRGDRSNDEPGDQLVFPR